MRCGDLLRPQGSSPGLQGVERRERFVAGGEAPEIVKQLALSMGHADVRVRDAQGKPNYPAED